MRGKENARGGARQGVLEEQLRIEKLESENYELKLKIRMFERKHSAAAAPAGPNNSKQLEAENAKLVEHNTELETECARLKAKVSSLPQEIAAKYQKQVDEFFERVRAELVAKRKLELRVAQLENENTLATPPPPPQTQNQPQSPAIDQLSREISSVRMAKAQVEAQLTDLQSRYDQVVQNAQSLEQELEAARAEGAVPDPYAEAELQRLKIAHDDACFENSHLKEKLKYMERSIEEMEQQVRTASKRAVETAATNTCSQDTEEKLKSQIRRLEIQLANAKHEMESSITPHELAVAKEDLSRVRIELAEVQAEKKALEDKLRAAHVQLEVTENRSNEMKKREAQRKASDMRMLSQRSELEKELENARMAKIGLEEKTQVLETSLLREVRARQTTMHRNTELEHALARPTEPTRIIESSRMHLNLNDARENDRSRNLNLDSHKTSKLPSFDAHSPEHRDKNNMEALKVRLGISSEPF